MLGHVICDVCAFCFVLSKIGRLLTTLKILRQHINFVILNGTVTDSESCIRMEVCLAFAVNYTQQLQEPYFNMDQRHRPDWAVKLFRISICHGGD